MSETPVVSIIGRPNVGKSSLFNRIVGKRIAVVDDFPGVTRDRNYIPAEWNDIHFSLVDTGGLIPNVHDSIPEAIHDQVRIAIDESVVVLFLVDAQTGPTDLDLLIARRLRKGALDKVLLVANKADSPKTLMEIDEYRKLGIGKPVPVSAIHGKGVADLLDMVVDRISKNGYAVPRDVETAQLKIAVVGRPNAGKSSLINKLLGKNRMIIDDVPGTTRDAVDSVVEYGGRRIVLIDTAGLRKKSHVKQDLEYFSNIRALDSIARSDITVILIDVTVGVGIQDLRIIRKVYEMRKGLLLAWNKWDIKEKTHTTFDTITAETRREYMELRPIPMIAVSALTGKRVTGVLDMAFTIKERMLVRVPASEFEDKVFEWVRTHPHPITPGREVRFLGARQLKADHPYFRFFVTNPKEVTSGYVRYLTNKIYETYDFEGCPLELDFKGAAKPKHRSGRFMGIGAEEQEEQA